MIITPLFDKFRNGEFVKFFDNLITITFNKDPVALKIDPHIAEVQSGHDKLSTIYKQERGNKLTTTLVGYDQLRDRSFSGMRTITKTYAEFHEDESLQEKANALLEVIDLYGNIVEMNYQEQGAALDDIIEKIEKKQMIPLLDDLNLISWYNNMKEAQQKFDEAYLARNQAYTLMPDVSVADLRKVIVEAYRKLSQYLIAYATIEPSATYDQYIKELNTLIESYNRTVEKRKYQTPEEAKSFDKDFEELEG